MSVPLRAGKLGIVLATVAFGLSDTPASRVGVQTRRLEPHDSRWEFSGEARPTTHEGEDVLYLRRGSALRPEIRFEDGTIEFDMLPTDRRTFLGVLFRVPEAGGHMEDIYFRLHKSGLPDAVQYSPDYHGRGQWQLYHGPAATAPATYEPGAWQQVRIEVRGDRAAVFVGDDAAEPSLVVDPLRAGVSEGYLGFWGNFPGAAQDDPPTALVRNVTLRPGVTSYEFPAPRPESGPGGVISVWSVSRPFVRSGPVVEELPPDVLAGDWRTVESERSGLVPLDRYLERPEGGAAAVLAGITLRSDLERVVPMQLGFSDDASVFLKGPDHSGPGDPLPCAPGGRERSRDRGERGLRRLGPDGADRGPRGVGPAAAPLTPGTAWRSRGRSRNFLKDTDNFSMMFEASSPASRRFPVAGRERTEA